MLGHLGVAYGSQLGNGHVGLFGGAIRLYSYCRSEGTKLMCFLAVLFDGFVGCVLPPIARIHDGPTKQCTVAGCCPDGFVGWLTATTAELSCVNDASSLGLSVGRSVEGNEIKHNETRAVPPVLHALCWCARHWYGTAPTSE